MRKPKTEEPWKTRDVRFQISQKERNQKDLQRARVNNKLTQRVKIYCNKSSLFLPPGLFNSFTVKVKIPLRESEFAERMKAAFPELKWEKF